MAQRAEDAGAEHVRYRCTQCGNLTRFDVVERRRTRSYYHFTIGGTLRIEESDVLERDVEEVVCRWCNSSDNVEEARSLEAVEEQPG